MSKSTGKYYLLFGILAFVGAGILAFAESMKEIMEGMHDFLKIIIGLIVIATLYVTLIKKE